MSDIRPPLPTQHSSPGLVAPNGHRVPILLTPAGTASHEDASSTLLHCVCVCCVSVSDRGVQCVCVSPVCGDCVCRIVRLITRNCPV